MSYLERQTEIDLAVLHSVWKETVRQERLKADGRFKYTCRDPEMTHHERLTVLMEEVGEAARAILEIGDLANDKHGADLRKELIQVAAVALSWVKGMDERDPAKVAQADPLFKGVREEWGDGSIRYDINSSFPKMGGEALTDELPHYADTESSPEQIQKVIGNARYGKIPAGHADGCVRPSTHFGDCRTWHGAGGTQPRDEKRPAEESELPDGEAMWDAIEEEIAADCEECGGTGRDGNSSASCPACLGPEEPVVRIDPWKDLADKVEHPNEPFTIRADEGKYTFFVPNGDWKVHVLRYGEPWLKIENGHKAILALMYEVDTAYALVKAREDHIVKLSAVLDQSLSGRIDPWKDLADKAEAILAPMSALDIAYDLVKERDDLIVKLLLKIPAPQEPGPPPCKQISGCVKAHNHAGDCVTWGEPPKPLIDENHGACVESPPHRPCFTCAAIDPDPCHDIHNIPMDEPHPVRSYYR